MTSLINSGPRDAAFPSCVSDHSHQIGVLMKTSSRTFESTRVTELVPARDCHDLIGGKTWTCNTNKLCKPVGLPRAIGFFDHDATICGAAEFNPSPGGDPEVFADSVRNR